jgi:hypothetical protein
MIPVARGRRFDIRDIRASYKKSALKPPFPSINQDSNLTIRLRNPQTKPNIPPRNPRQPPTSLLGRPKPRNWRTPNPITTAEAPSNAHEPRPHELIPNNQTAPRIPFLRRHVPRQRQPGAVLGACQRVHHAEAQFAMSPPRALGDLACGFPFLGVWRDVRFHVVPDVGAEVVVQVCVVGVLDVELGEERFAVGGCWEVRWCHNGG